MSVDGKIRVVIADDVELCQELLSNILRNEQCEVVACAADGESAWRSILQHQPDIVFLDVEMPIMSGMDILRMAKEKGQNLYAVIVSGESDFEQIRLALELGAKAYVTKPVTDDRVRQVLNCFRRCFRRGRTSATL